MHELRTMNWTWVKRGMSERDGVAPNIYLLFKREFDLDSYFTSYLHPIVYIFRSHLSQ